MKKWVAIIVIALIVIINPSKINTFTKKNIENKNIKELNKIEKKEDTKYMKYQDCLIVENDEELLSINTEGEVDDILKLSKGIENFELSSSTYIDIVDKKDNKVTSIDGTGKTKFTDKVYQDVLIYKSINKDTFVSVYSNEGKEYVNIQDSEKMLIKEIEYSSKVTHLESLNDKFIVIDLNTDKDIYSKLNLYDTNGQLIKGCEFDEVIIDVIYQNNYIYIAFENEIIILDTELNEKSSIKIKGLKNLEKDNNESIFVVDNESNIICIENGKEKSIKYKPDIESIEPFNNDYITYSHNRVFDSNNKGVVNIDGIKEIIYMGDNTIAVDVGSFINIIELTVK